MSRYWGCLFPLLEDGDATARLNVLAGLSDRIGVLRQLREAIVVRSAGGEVTVGDLAVHLDAATRARLTTADREALEIRLHAARREDRVLDAIADSARWLGELRATLLKASVKDTHSLDGLLAVVDQLRGWSRTQGAQPDAQPRSWYVGGDRLADLHFTYWQLDS